MRHARLAALTAAAVLAIAACSSSASPTPSAAAPTLAPATPPVASSGGASVAPASVVPSTAPSIAPSAGSSAATGDAVSIADFSFQPATLTVPVGATVKWTNNDSTGHTVTADDGSFKSERLGSGAAYSQTFATAGTFAYHCSIHPGMKGTITVQ
jgi:plastocyanin